MAKKKKRTELLQDLQMPPKKSEPEDLELEDEELAELEEEAMPEDDEEMKDEEEKEETAMDLTDAEDDDLVAELEARGYIVTKEEIEEETEV